MRTNQNEVQETQKMKVEIWSDIMCPFCYIGKRHYEAAIEQFDNNDKLEVVWKSFQLDPSIPIQMDTPLGVYQYLAERKGISYAESEAMHLRVNSMAKEVGLAYNLDIAVVANSFKAHRIIQFAKKKALGEIAEEHFFRAYFILGRNLGNTETLVEIGKEIGLTDEEIQEALTNEDYARLVNQDIAEARNLGIRGVPFFLFNQKQGISGAQPIEIFRQTLQNSFSEWLEANPSLGINRIHGDVCTPDGDCD